MTDERSKRIFERWQTFSLFEQLGNIGSEIARAHHWQGKDEKLLWHSTERALELFDFTLEDPRWRNSVLPSRQGGPASPSSQGGRLREIARAREVFCNAILKGEEYRISLDDLNRYFLFFASVARKNLLPSHGKSVSGRSVRSLEPQHLLNSFGMIKNWNEVK